MYTQVFDKDDGTDDEFVDSFSINVEQIPVGEETSPRAFTGTFGFASIEMSFKVECSSGYTGDSCEVNILNTCIGVDCSSNGECINILDACNCFPGYTGASCEVDINDCIGVNCSGNGECIDGVNSFKCYCSPGYIGFMCEVEISDSKCVGISLNDYLKAGIFSGF